MLPCATRLLVAWALAWALAWPGLARADSSRWTESTRLLVGVETRLRFLAEMPSPAERAARSYLVAIVWRYADDGGERLLPSLTDALRLVRAEHLIEDGIERRGIGMLAGAMTGGLQHEWLYYTADPKAFAHAFNRLAVDMPDWPVRLLTEPDPNWDAYLLLRRQEFALR